MVVFYVIIRIRKIGLIYCSLDPALGEYIPKAPIDEEAKKYNQNLPGMGGVFNHINGNLYHYAGNNPVKYTDPDGRSLFSEGLTFLRHPIAATKVGRASDGGTNLSSIATNFTINLGLSWNDYGKGRQDEGSPRGAFRHSLWQAIITKSFGCKIADDIGKGHDPKIPDFKESYEKLSDADTMADNLNNIIGRSIGMDNNKSNTEMAQDVLDFYHDIGLFTVTQTQDGKYSVSLSKLSDEEYNSASQKLKNLNDEGMNK